MGRSALCGSWAGGLLLLFSMAIPAASMAESPPSESPPTAEVVTAPTRSVAPLPAPTTSHALFAGGFLSRDAALHAGLSLAYANEDWLDGRPRWTLSYSTSRLSGLVGRNTLNEDRFRLATGWYFRPDAVVTPYLQVGLGLVRYDRVDTDLFALLPNSAALLSFHVGAEGPLIEERIRVYADVGYNHINSATVYPLQLTVGVHYRLPMEPR